MTTVKAFDELMTQFIKELHETFPGEPEPSPLDCKTFVKLVTPWAGALSAKDGEGFFCKENTLLNLPTFWNHPDCSDATKDAIWQYLQSLYMVGTTLNMIPADTLSMIEKAAENCARNMKLSPDGKFDEKSIMEGMNSMLRQMMNQQEEPSTPRRIQNKPKSRKH